MFVGGRRHVRSTVTSRPAMLSRVREDTVDGCGCGAASCWAGGGDVVATSIAVWPLTAVYSGAALIGLGVAWLAWKRREAPGALSLAALSLCGAIWALGDLPELWAADVSTRMLATAIAYPAIGATSTLMFLTVLSLTRRHRLLTPVVKVLLALWVVASPVAVWTNGWHHLYYSRVAIDPVTGITHYEHGPLYWASLPGDYLLLIVSLVIMMRASFHEDATLRPALRLATAALLLPWIGNSVYALELGPWPGLDWPVVCHIGAGTLFAWSLLRYDLLDPLPLAGGLVLDRLTDGIVLLDTAGKVVASNAAARAHVGLDLRLALGLADAATAPQGDVQTRLELRAGSPASVKHLDLRAVPVQDPDGRPLGRVVRIADVTAEEHESRERERLITELQSALDEARTLQGLLPICASCKKIRDARGYWSQLEAYLAAHSELSFAESRCPECAATAKNTAAPDQAASGGGR